MLIDDVKIHIKAGHGGDGKVAFNKNLMSLGPVGGSGGKGGDVIFEGVSDIGRLYQFRNRKALEAQDGDHGHGQYRDGPDGIDTVAQVPVGTVIHNLSTGTSIEITRAGERIIAAHGGKGGRGNFHFRSAINTSPEEFEPGTEGEEFDIRLELKLIADIGLIGLPNAGKSTFITTFTKSKSKVANYAFTTLEPHLGSYYGLILADIPGLIEGAAEGRGLGIKFLRHVERTNTLIHFISSESQDPVADYNTIRAELEKYNPELLHKKEYVFLTKTDMIDDGDVTLKLDQLKKHGIQAQPFNILDDKLIKSAEKILNAINDLKQKTDD